jgi:hypothetical protein
MYRSIELARRRRVEESGEPWKNGAGYASEAHSCFDSLIDCMRDDSYVWFVAMALRPMVRAFCMALEYRYFPPAPVNPDFQFNVLQWEGMLWVVAGIPAEHRDKAEAVAREFGLALRWGGLPLMMDGNGLRRFPSCEGADYEHVATVESDSGSEVYRAGGQEFLRDVESRECDKIWAAFQASKA